MANDPGTEVHDDAAPVSSTASGGSAGSGGSDGLFDAPSWWRAEAAVALGLRDDDLIAAMSAGAGCPSVLASMAASITPCDGTLSIVVDIGAGTGGVSEWFRRRTNASVIAIEPAAGARRAALTLFPGLCVREGSAEETGLGDGAADAVVVCGVLSLITDIGAVLEEVDRVVRPGGTLAVADVFSAGADAIRSGPNVFRSIEQMVAALAVRGWVIAEVGCGAPDASPTWAVDARRVDEWIHRTHRQHPAYGAWRDDQRHLERHIAAGDLVAGCIVAHR